MWVRVAISPDDAANETGSFHIKGSTGFDKTISITHDNYSENPGDNTIDMHFGNVPTTASYTLFYVASDGTESLVIKNIAYKDLEDGGEQSTQDNPEPTQEP